MCVNTFYNELNSKYIVNFVLYTIKCKTQFTTRVHDLYTSSGITIKSIKIFLIAYTLQIKFYPNKISEKSIKNYERENKACLGNYILYDL